MDTSWASLSQHALLSELDNIEREIARSRALHVYTDGAGQTRARVSPELLALAEREQLIISALRRR